MNTQVLLIALSALSTVVAGVAIYLWQRQRRAAKAAAREQAEAQRRLAIAESERQTAYDSCTKLRTDLKSQRARTYLDQFRQNTFYKLLAKGSAELGGQSQSYGLVSLQNGVVVPFLVKEGIEHLEVGDTFTSVRDHLVKLKPDMVDIAQPQTPVTSTASGESLQGSTMPPTGTGRGANTDATLVAGAIAADAPFLSTEQDEGAKTVMFTLDQRSAALPSDPTLGMPYLKVVSGNDQGTVFYLPFGNSTIGRSSSNTIMLNDQVASRHHCHISYENGRFLLQDDDSTNGTRCNDETVRSHALEFGDRIDIANTELLFTCDGYESKEQDPQRAIATFEACLQRQPGFIAAIKLLAFLLERNVARQKEAAPLWDRIIELEKVG